MEIRIELGVEGETVFVVRLRHKLNQRETTSISETLGLLANGAEAVARHLRGLAREDAPPPQVAGLSTAQRIGLVLRGLGTGAYPEPQPVVADADLGRRRYGA